MADFRPCSARRPCSQAPFYHCARRAISIRPEGTFARLRYSLGGDRPSQTARLPVSPGRFCGVGVRPTAKEGWYFNGASAGSADPASKAPTYPTRP